MLSKALVAEARGRQKSGKPTMNSKAVEEWLRSKVKFQSGNASAKQSISKQMKALAGSLKPGSVGGGINWSATSAWNIEDVKKKEQGIFINLENRDKEGIIPFNEHESFQRKLIGALKELRTGKGRPLFVSVEPNQDKADNGSGKADIPDILVEVNRESLTDDFVFRSKDDRDPIPLDAIRWVYTGSGDHLPNGIFVVTGKNTKGFCRLDVNLYDIAPTILWALDFPVGADMPGRVLEDAFIDPVFSRKLMLISSWSDVIKTKMRVQVSVPDVKRLQQLRALGYIQP